MLALLGLLSPVIDISTFVPRAAVALQGRLRLLVHVDAVFLVVGAVVVPGRARRGVGVADAVLLVVLAGVGLQRRLRLLAHVDAVTLVVRAGVVPGRARRGVGV